MTDNFVTWEAMDALVAGLKKDAAAIKKDMGERVRWRGTFKTGDVYHENDLVQDRSAIFVCTGREVKDRPLDSGGWRMLAQFKGGTK